MEVKCDQEWDRDTWEKYTLRVQNGLDWSDQRKEIMSMNELLYRYEKENLTQPSSVEELLQIVRMYWNNSDQYDHVTLDHRAHHIGRIVPRLLRECYDVEHHKHKRIVAAIKGEQSSSVDQKLEEWKLRRESQENERMKPSIHIYFSLCLVLSLHRTICDIQIHVTTEHNVLLLFY